MSRGRLLASFALGMIIGSALSAGFFLSRPAIRLDEDVLVGPSVFRTRVKSVVDGDTVVLENGLHLRYAGIDTPETVEVREIPDAFTARAAADRNRVLTEGKEVIVSLTPERTDKYGRLLGTITLDDGTDVQKLLVSEGLARLTGFSAPAPRELLEAEKTAREQGLGIWAAAPAPAAASEAAFVASRNSSVYHLRTCSKAANIKPGNLLFFRSEKEARSSGRIPCPFCLPDAPGRAQEPEPPHPAAAPR